ncbi:MAG: DUF4214 domain-containing protein, partial [Bryobacteraceae bacterium]|nr:DUF4214 domain-containing protein [Bryobacteraceae bacterium]
DEDGTCDEDYPAWPFLSRDTILSSAVVWDLNSSGQKKIIFGQDYTTGVDQEFSRGGVLRVLDPRGQQVAGFPKGNLEQVIWSSPAVVDLDNDGNYEIIHGTGPELSSVGATPAEQLIGQLVYAWRSNGAPFIAANANGRFATTEGRTSASFAVGDLDNDGSPELVIVTLPLKNQGEQFIDAAGNPLPSPVVPGNVLGQKLYVFRANGTLFPGFPLRPAPTSPGASTGSPILADVDGDNFLDIILPIGQGLMVFDRTGRVLPGMGVFENLQDDDASAEVGSTPSIADLDGDGTVEVVWTAPGPGTTGRVRVVTLGAFNAATYQRSWPQWRRTVNRNGVFGSIISLVQGYEAAGVLTVAAQAFSGRDAVVSVIADLTTIGGGQTALVAQANSYYRGTLNVAALAPGRYNIPITLRDAANRTDTQTLVFVKLGGIRQLAVSTSTLAFGSVLQTSTGSQQVGLVNVGTQPLTISSATTNSAEFTVVLQLPTVLQPGASTLLGVRFRPNASLGNRNAVLTINTDAGARTVALTGSAPAGSAGCSVTVNPASIEVATEGRQGTFAVTTAPAGCAWTATSDAKWLQFFPPSGAGNTTVSYTVFPNFAVTGRFGHANINGTVFTVLQRNNQQAEDRRFVAANYFAFLGRYPTPSEIDFHVANLPATGRSGLAFNFLNTPEFDLIGKFVAGLYVGLLNRDAEYGGFLFQRQAITGGFTTPAGLVGAFLGAPEFVTRYGALTKEEFVRVLYRQILLREPSLPEVTLQANTITDQQSRVNLATAFLNTAEFRQSTGARLYAFLLYAVLLQRDPTAAEAQNFVGRITTADTLRPLITELLATYEFRRIIL